MSTDKKNHTSWRYVGIGLFFGALLSRLWNSGRKADKQTNNHSEKEKEHQNTSFTEEI